MPKPIRKRLSVRIEFKTEIRTDNPQADLAALEKRLKEDFVDCFKVLYLDEENRESGPVKDVKVEGKYYG
jgi:hypothetical protein